MKSTTDWSDYVFDKDYSLLPLEQVECFIKKNHHLPNMHSASDIVNTGLDIAKIDAKLLEKIEELTLYMIQLKKDNEKLKERISILENKYFI